MEVQVYVLASIYKFTPFRKHIFKRYQRLFLLPLFSSDKISGIFQKHGYPVSIYIFTPSGIMLFIKDF
jgi:hypothetical protein